jgi:hypothetical protein
MRNLNWNYNWQCLKDEQLLSTSSKESLIQKKSWHHCRYWRKILNIAWSSFGVSWMKKWKTNIGRDCWIKCLTGELIQGLLGLDFLTMNIVFYIMRMEDCTVVVLRLSTAVEVGEGGPPSQEYSWLCASPHSLLCIRRIQNGNKYVRRQVCWLT